MTISIADATMAHRLNRTLRVRNTGDDTVIWRHLRLEPGAALLITTNRLDIAAEAIGAALGAHPVRLGAGPLEFEVGDADD